ncbi:MAG: TonB-dependent receptor, partial [Flavobacteriaceae bacterium]|nr:TonB-dependent receptor [Flavobacteriaceae bacterium]
MNKKTRVLGVCCTLITTLGFAQQESETNAEQLDEIVITDSRFKIKKEDSGKVITKITQEELQQLQGKSIAEIINATSGIEINGAKSSPGQNLSYFVRGGR